MTDALGRLQALVRIPTVSRYDEAQTDWAAFQQFRELLQQLYPALHRELEFELVENHSILYRWKGLSGGPVSVLMAHYDVVPATEEGWEHPPFAAEVSGDGENALVWGRGTLDDKGDLAALFEAVEALATTGFRPQNDIYLAIGHDEETTGSGGKAAAGLLGGRGVRPALVLDEGGAVAQHVFPGVEKEIALVGVAERGSATVLLTVEQKGGHAAFPPAFSATVRLARAIQRLNGKRFRPRFAPTTIETIRTLGRHARNPYRWIFGNLWLTRPLLLRVFAKPGTETDALVRSTQAVTMLEAGQAPNALAEKATATVNLRVAVGSSIDAAIAHLTRAIHDAEVGIQVLHPNEPTPPSQTSGPAWQAIEQTVGEVFPGAVTTPYVMFGATDSRHYAGISSGVYRFSPFRMSKEERGTLHAKNERMHVATYLRGIEFYTKLIGRL